MSNDQDSLFRSLFSNTLSKGEKKKREVLDCVIRSIAKSGLDGTTFESVGKIAKLRKSHIAYYFPEREIMIESAVKFATAVGQEITIEYLKKAKTPKDRILAIADGFFYWLETYPDHGAVWLLLFFLAGIDTKYRELHTQIRDVGAERLETALKALSPPPKDCKVLARTLQTLIFGGMVDALATGKKPHLKETHSRIRTMIASLI